MGVGACDGGEDDDMEGGRVEGDESQGVRVKEGYVAHLKSPHNSNHLSLEDRAGSSVSRRRRRCRNYRLHTLGGGVGDLLGVRLR